MTAHDLMTLNPVTVNPQASIAEAWDLMRDLEVRHLPVVRGGELVGMLGDRDLAHLNISRILADKGADVLREELATPVINVMSPEPIFVEPETAPADVVRILIEQKVGALPVVQPDTRQVVGIVSYIDVLRAIQDYLEED